MSNFLDFRESSFGSRSNDQVITAINSEEFLDEIRLSNSTEFSAETADLNIEGAMSAVEEDLLLVPQNAPEALNLGQNGDGASGTSLELGKDILTGDTDDSTLGEMDTLTGGNTDGVEIEARSRSLQPRNNSLSRAYNVGTLNGSRTFSGSVGTTDINDYFRFYISKESNFNLLLNGLSSNADVDILGDTGKVLRSFSNSGNSPDGLTGATIAPGTYYVKVYSDGSGNTDYSLKLEATSSSSSSDEEVNITSPSSSTSLEPGDRYTIRWRDNFRDNVKLELYKGSSFKQTISSSTYSDGSYSWRVPTSLSSGSDYKIRIRNVNDSSVYDDSSSFTIEPDEYVYLSSPSSSTNLEPGDNYTIRWNDNFRDNVKLDLYKGGSYKQTISSSTYSDGSYSWRVPTSLSSGSDYKIRIRNVNDSSVYDDSSSFTIEPDEYVYLSSPSSSTSLEPGDRYTIRWRDNFSDRVRLDLYKGGSFKQTISRSVFNDGDYFWRVPTYLSSGSDYKIKIRNVNDSSVYDDSNSFTIKSQAGGSSKPDIDIKLYDPNKSFTETQQGIIAKAAQNWERIITGDKDDSGILRIVITEGSTALEGNSWEKDTLAETYHGNYINYRRDINRSNVDIGGNNYHNRIKFNSKFLDDLSPEKLMSVAMHEIGHTLGLDHEKDSESLMYEKYNGENEFTEKMYSSLEELGYEFDRNATIYWS